MGDVRRDACQGDREIDRLGDIVVRTEPKPLDHVAALALRGDHDDGQVGRRASLAHAAQDLKAVQVRHHDVEQDQVKRLVLDQVERHPTVFGGRDAVAMELETATEHVTVELFIVDQEATMPPGRS